MPNTTSLPFTGESLQHAANRNHMVWWKRKRGMERRGSLSEEQEPSMRRRKTWKRGAKDWSYSSNTSSISQWISKEMYLCILGAQKYFLEQLPPVLPGLALGSCDLWKGRSLCHESNLCSEAYMWFDQMDILLTEKFNDQQWCGKLYIHNLLRRLSSISSVCIYLGQK